jgi:hypothetical protein
MMRTTIIRSMPPAARRAHKMRLFAGICSAALFSLAVFGQSSSFDSRSVQTASPAGVQKAALDREVSADMSFLASDELRGRGSATRDEHIAAMYVAARFQSLGLEPGGTDDSYVQKVTLPLPLPARAQQRVSRLEDVPRTETWNAIGIFRGTDSADEVVLLTAHLDHLGIGPPNSSGDAIYNGADDDASGTTAVMALAKALASGARPRRTIVFALFGSEEMGGFGNAGFLAHPPVPLSSVVANLEFEMIGRPDPAIPSDSLWLTGFERSNLGSELVKHGAHLVPDPHPQQMFFQRSDNIALARQGIVAQTVSSFGLHKDYHQPSDELSTIDFNHLEGAIASMVEPIRWLANNKWRPAWNAGGKP